MANNRVFLVCRECGEKKAIMKYYPSTKWTTQSMWHHQATLKRLASIEDWLEEHDHNPDLKGTMWGHEFFDLTFEIPDEKETS